MTMELIETKTLGTAAASIEFTSIPQGFTDLLLLCSLRTARASTIEGLLIGFNGSASNFTHRTLYGTGSSAASFSGSIGRAGVVNGNNSTANTFSNISIYIPNYSGATNKSYSVDSVQEHNGSAAFDNFLEITTGLWSQTTAINAVRLTPDLANNLLTASTVSLYGILKGSGGATVS